MQVKDEKFREFVWSMNFPRYLEELKKNQHELRFSSFPEPGRYNDYEEQIQIVQRLKEVDFTALAPEEILPLLFEMKKNLQESDYTAPQITFGITAEGLLERLINGYEKEVQPASDASETPVAPEISDASETSVTSETSDALDVTDLSEKHESSETSETQMMPDTSLMPETSDTFGASDMPESFEMPVASPIDDDPFPTDIPPMSHGHASLYRPGFDDPSENDQISEYFDDESRRFPDAALDQSFKGQNFSAAPTSGQDHHNSNNAPAGHFSASQPAGQTNLLNEFISSCCQTLRNLFSRPRTQQTMVAKEKGFQFFSSEDFDQKVGGLLNTWRFRHENFGRNWQQMLRDQSTVEEIVTRIRTNPLVERAMEDYSNAQTDTERQQVSAALAKRMAEPHGAFAPSLKRDVAELNQGMNRLQHSAAMTSESSLKEPLDRFGCPEAVEKNLAQYFETVLDKPELKLFASESGENLYEKASRMAKEALEFLKGLKNKLLGALRSEHEPATRTSTPRL